MLTIILSDVIGDPLDIIASGPTVRPAAASAAEIAGQYNLTEDTVGSAVMELLLSHPASLDSDAQQDYSHVQNIIVGSISLALQAVVGEAVRVPYTVVIGVNKQ